MYMQKFLSIVLIACCGISLYGQDKEAKEVTRKDSVLRAMLRDECYCAIDPRKCPKNSKRKYYYTNRQYITNYSMNRLIRRDLTKITLDEEGLPVIGNYASMKISEDKTKVTFNASFFNPFKKMDSVENTPIKTILSFNVKAGISDGVTDLFTNRNINNEAGIKIKYSRLTKKTLYENDSSVDCNTLKLYRERLLFEYDLIKKRFRYDSIDYKTKASEFAEKAKKMRADTVQFRKTLDSLKALPPSTNPAVTKKIDTLIKVTDTLLVATALKYFDLQKEYNEFQAKKPAYKTKELVDSFYRRLLDMETKYAKWTRFSMNWWDLDLGFDGKKYILYSAGRPLDSQISKKPFTQWTVGVSYNHFASKESQAFLKHGLFLKLSYMIGNDNSLSGLETKEVRTTIWADTPNFRREVIEKVNAYDAVFNTTFSHTFKFQFSKYLNEKRTSAISFYNTWVLAISKLGKPLDFEGDPDITAGIGYLFGFLDKEKEKNIINLELFLNFNDLLNSSDDDSKFFGRHQLGIKFGVPFNSLFINQK